MTGDVDRGKARNGLESLQDPRLSAPRTRLFPNRIGRNPLKPWKNRVWNALCVVPSRSFRTAYFTGNPVEELEQEFIRCDEHQRTG